MDSSINFILEGTPRALSRTRVSCRHGTINVFDPQKEEKEQARLQLMPQIAREGHLLGYYGPISAEMTFHMPIPKIHTRYQATGLPHFFRPDIDNMVKYYLDIMTKILFDDDCKVFEICAKKVYSDRPRIEIKLKKRLFKADDGK